MKRLIFVLLAALAIFAPVALFAQTEGSEIVSSIWQVFVAVGAVGFLTNLIHQFVKKLTVLQAGFSEGWQRITNVAIAEALAALHHLTGIALPDTLAGIDGAVIEGVLATGFSALVYFLLKAAGVQKAKAELLEAARRG
jgi:hypothetical protein